MPITTSVVEVVYEIVSYTSIETRHENLRYKTNKTILYPERSPSSVRVGCLVGKNETPK
jgi:hypothetical protein